VSRIMMFAIIDLKIGLVDRVNEKRLTGRFALRNRKNLSSRFVTYSCFIGNSAPKTVKSRR
jgi:hypothetical protein